MEKHRETSWDNPRSENLFETILTLRDLKEAKKFFRDLLTEREILELSNRWKAANMLYQKIPYSIIALETGLSSTTIARISKWLKTGKGGYKILLDRMGK